MESHERKRVAIVGSGLAGLVTAHLLSRDSRQRYIVKIFESGSTPSLDAASVSIPNATQTSSERVDLPMRAFAGGYYHNLRALYDYLGVKYSEQPFLFNFSKADSAPATPHASCDTSYFVHASNLHRLAPRPTGMGFRLYLAQLMYLVACYTWFSLCCFLIAPARGETVQQYLNRVRMPQRFTNYYLLPLISSVTTCPHQALLAFPATDLTEYKRKTHLAPHYTVSEGVKGVQERLISGITMEMNASVTAVKATDKGVQVSWTQSNGTRAMQTESFDRVILAVAPDVVGRIFEPLRYHMSRIPTAVVESIVHTDKRVLGQKNDMVTNTYGAQLINLHTSHDHNPRTESHHVQRCGAIVTTCPFGPIDPAQTVQSAKFTRVLRSPESQRIVNAIFDNTLELGSEKSVPSWRNGDMNVWLVGGWCWDGMVLLEGCVLSAMRVANAFDADVPWRPQ